VFDRLGAELWAERARRELARAGRRIPSSGGAARPRSDDAREEITIRTLGGFEVVRDGRSVGPAEWQSRKARSLLKILIAARGRSVTRESLMEALWPEGDPHVLGNRLSVTLTTLRSTLDPGRRHPPDRFVRTESGSVRANTGNLPVDIDRFLEAADRGLEAEKRGDLADAGALLSEAATLYAGDFLPEDLYEDWSVAVREEARAVMVSVSRARARLAMAGGDLDGAERHLARVLQQDPYDEPAHLELVRLLAGNGRHGEALRAHDAYAARMKEIGVDPTPFLVVAPPPHGEEPAGRP
jgi:DNA-binding SARP family transcriptional activator